MASSINASTSGAGGVITSADNSGILNIQTAGTTAVTVDASQNVGIGTASPSRKLTVLTSTDTPAQFASSGANAYVQLTGSADVYLGSVAGAFTTTTGAAERMRIDSSGVVWVNSTSVVSGGVTGKFNSLAVNGNYCGIAASVPNGSDQSGFVSQSVATGATSWYHLVGKTGNGSTINANSIIIFGNGNIQNTNNSYGAFSDIKLKENIVNATPKLNDLLNVKVRNYNLKSDEAKTKQIGVVAQELEEVFPSLVDEDVDGIKSVKYSVFVPMLIKAIQEQQAIITQLQADVAALKGTK